MAQSVERRPVNPEVPASSPGRGAICKALHPMFRAGLFHCVAAAIAAAAHSGQSAHRHLWPLFTMTPPHRPGLKPDDPLPLPAARWGPNDPAPGLLAAGGALSIAYLC